MPNELLNLVKQHIKIKGAMDMACFMEYCLAHPQYGYYASRDPFGVQGDFVTAPEISQLFGEMIGIFFRQIHGQMGCPEPIHIVECGAGRGSMMRDMLRVIKPHIKCTVHIVEISKSLRQIQKETIKDDDIIWHDTIETLPHDAPIFIVGNEFLDAIPTRQAIAHNGEWYEHCISLHNDELVFVLGAKLQSPELPAAKDGEFFEFSPIREQIHQDLSTRVEQQKGVLLWIDYGFDKGMNTKSVQGMKDHKYTNILHDIGRADISSLVDFEKLAMITSKNLQISGVMKQGDFLRECGIEIRKNMLIEKNPEHKDIILSGYHRLIDDEQMGTLFKALAVVKL